MDAHENVHLLLYEGGNMFGFTEKELLDKGAYLTVSEIYKQPETWKQTMKIIQQNLSQFVSLFTNKKRRIIITGAGSSDYVGQTVARLVHEYIEYEVDAIPTTDLLTDPFSYLRENESLVLISVARSGNSPESKGVIDLLTQLIDVKHVIITCNSKGEIIKNALNDRESLCVVLDEETNDRSLAMTSSFSNLLLCTYGLCIGLSHHQKFDLDTTFANKWLNNDFSKINFDQQFNIYERIIYLGSHEYRAIAQECALKLLELTAGSIVSYHESFLGFRHGPKAVINQNSILVMLMNNDYHVCKYENDLLKEIINEDEFGKLIILGDTIVDITNNHRIIKLELDGFNSRIQQTLNYVLVGQTLATLASINLGFNTDSPFKNKRINRVVEGVNVYPWSVSNE